MNPHIKWFYNEIPKLIKDGILSPDAGKTLQKHYEDQPGGKSSDSSSTLLAVFGTIGAVLCSLGIILLLAFNWKQLGTTPRIVISVAPLLTSQFLAFLLLRGKDASTAWRNTVAAFWGLSCAGAIALISQTYSIQGSIDQFLFALIICVLPILFITRCFTADILYLLLISAWAIATQVVGGQAMLFWLFFAPFFIRYILTLKKDRTSGASLYLSHFAAISLIINTGISLEKVLPGLWIPVYSALFSLLYLSGTLLYEDQKSIIKNPLLNFGKWGSVILGAIFTYTWPWEDIGWEYARIGEGFHELASIGDFAILGLYTIGTLGAGYLIVRQRKLGHLLTALILPFGAIAFYLAAQSQGSQLLLIHLIFNLYLLIIGITHLILGFKIKDLAQINSGTLILGVLIAMRFIFVEDFFSALIVRGLIFIALGAGFFAINLWLSRYFKKNHNQESKNKESLDEQN